MSSGDLLVFMMKTVFAAKTSFKTMFLFIKKSRSWKRVSPREKELSLQAFTQQLSQKSNQSLLGIFLSSSGFPAFLPTRSFLRTYSIAHFKKILKADHVHDLFRCNFSLPKRPFSINGTTRTWMEQLYWENDDIYIGSKLWSQKIGKYFAPMFHLYNERKRKQRKRKATKNIKS